MVGSINYRFSSILCRLERELRPTTPAFDLNAPDHLDQEINPEDSRDPIEYLMPSLIEQTYARFGLSGPWVTSASICQRFGQCLSPFVTDNVVSEPQQTQDTEEYDICTYPTIDDEVVLAHPQFDWLAPEIDLALPLVPALSVQPIEQREVRTVSSFLTWINAVDRNCLFVTSLRKFACEFWMVYCLLLDKIHPVCQTWPMNHYSLLASLYGKMNCATVTP